MLEQEGDCNIAPSTFDKEELGDEDFDDLDEIDASNPYGDWATVQQEDREQKARGKKKHKKKKKKNKDPSNTLDGLRNCIVNFEKTLIAKRKTLKQMLEIDKELTRSDNPCSHPNLSLVTKLGLDVEPEERQKRINKLRQRIEKLLLIYEEKQLTLQIEERAHQQELQTPQESEEQQQLQLLQQDQHPHEQQCLPHQQNDQYSHQICPQELQYPPHEQKDQNPIEQYQEPKKNLSKTKMGLILQRLAGCEMKKDSDALQGVEVIIVMLQFLEEFYQTRQNHQVCEIVQQLKTNVDIVKTVMQNAGILT